MKKSEAKRSEYWFIRDKSKPQKYRKFIKVILYVHPTRVSIQTWDSSNKQHSNWNLREISYLDYHTKQQKTKDLNWAIKKYLKWIKNVKYSKNTRTKSSLFPLLNL
jgi:hypothetical protein